MREVRIGLPQVGVGVAAEIHDESLRLKNATWQWQRGETSDGTFTDIPAEQGGTSRVYVSEAADLGKWLKALATYENAFGPGKMVSGVSGQAVFSQPIMSNAGQISDIGYVLQQPDTVNIAQAFTTGGNPSGYSLSGLRFGIYILTGADALSWALYADAAGEPAAEPLFPHIAVPSDSLDGVTRTFEDLVHSGFPLAPDTKYWAVLTASPLMEGTEGPTLGVAGISEWGENVILDGPAAELDPGSESGWTLDFSPLSTPQDPMSTEDWENFTESARAGTQRQDGAANVGIDSSGSDGVVRARILHGGRGRDAVRHGHAERGPGAHRHHPHRNDGAGRRNRRRLLRRAGQRDVQRRWAHRA